jgi:enoyl-CoA hydratase
MSGGDRHITISVDAGGGGVARLTLNRPKALNALSLAMIRDITKALDAWVIDDQITHVLMRGTSKDKATGEFVPFGAFCAGGDIRYFYEAVHSQPKDALNRASLEAFFTEEYELNFLIHNYPKPIIALMDGVVMGGGMGLTQGASTRIVTERTKMAMPETAIGLFPDVGGGYFLSRCADSKPGVGEYLALTGQMLNGQEALSAGLADVIVDSKQLEHIWNDPKSFLQKPFGMNPEPVGLSLSKSTVKPLLYLDLMQKHFAKTDVKKIILSLQADDSDWAKQALAKLQKNSPLMVAVTLEQIRRARTMTLADELRMERGMVHQCFADTPKNHSDTVEGIRALVIDKDQSPKWQPERVADVTESMVNAFFKAFPWQMALVKIGNTKASG